MSRTLIALLAAGLPLSFGGFQTAQAAQPGEVAAEKTLVGLMASEPDPEVFIGSKAPELKIKEWLRGEPVSSFEAGRTYVVEFWATWCGPCIMAFPHLAELQKEHADDLTVIGVNIWENTEGDERAEVIREFVSGRKEMAYTVALEEGTKMAEAWMEPAQMNGIPAAFIVNGEGRIAWIGHPMAMDEPLESIIKGEFDIEAARKQLREESMQGEAITMAGFSAFQRAVEKQSWDRALDLANALAAEKFQEMPRGLNALAWFLTENKEAPEKAHQLSYRLATQAAEQTDWNDWAILNTYAAAAHHNGKTEEAVKWQNKAIELAPDEVKDQLRERLEAFSTQG